MSYNEAQHTPGCGAQIHVTGTNGGTCGATKVGQTYLCPTCRLTALFLDGAQLNDRTAALWIAHSLLARLGG